MPILLGLGVCFGLFALYVSTRPAAFRIERSRTIDASPAALYALINDFRGWTRWSPWEKLDPALKRSYEGPSSGVGAGYRWAGNGKAGQGSMTILESVEDARVVVDLVFLKPFPAHNKSTFTFEPEGNRTKVTWVMEGQNNFAAKAFNVVVDVDKMLGKDFDSGLDAMADATASR